MVWLITFASCSLVGVPLLFREGWSMGELRQMARPKKKREKRRFGEAEQPEASAEPVRRKKSAGEVPVLRPSG